MTRLTKYAILILLAALFLVFSASCTYNPPQGYTEKHHTREEIVAFAKSIDPNATVSETYTETKIDDLNRDFREWDAVINGVECHVSSVGDFVWNTGFLGGEFAKQYYVIDTDYDYLVLEKILSERQPDWQMQYADIAAKYDWNDVLCVDSLNIEKRELTDQELENAWAQAYAIYQEYSTYPVRKRPYIEVVSVPISYSNHKTGERYLRIEGKSITDFSEQGKAKFFEEYRTAWDLIDEGLPIKD